MALIVAPSFRRNTSLVRMLVALLVSVLVAQSHAGFLCDVRSLASPFTVQCPAGQVFTSFPHINFGNSSITSCSLSLATFNQGVCRTSTNLQEYALVNCLNRNFCRFFRSSTNTTVPCSSPVLVVVGDCDTQGTSCKILHALSWLTIHRLYYSVEWL